MDNEVPLPPPPRIRHRSSPSKATSSSLNPAFRKSRQLSRAPFDDLSSQPSSDPALFSSDDIPASGLENYDGPGAAAGGVSRKRRYKGTWWGEMVMDPKRKRADFKEKRHVDSGVWMGSDESSAEVFSLTSEDASSCGEEFLKNNTAKLGPAKRVQSLLGIGGGDSNARRGPPHGPVFQPRAALRVEEPKEHQVARDIVNECLEKGKDSVDLSQGSMRTIPSGLLRPLLHLTKQPPVREPPVSENVFSSLEPFLRLFLSGNLLTSLPAELFELVTLKVLSLRNNKLTEIPPAIQNLKMLQEINVSVNRLQYLPWEILQLIGKGGELKHLVVHPNPFLQFEEAEIEEWHHGAWDGRKSPDDELKFRDYKGLPPEDAWAPIHVATGPVRRFNMEGLPVTSGKSYGGSQTQTSVDETHSRVPSLREVSLLACSKSPYFEQLFESDISSYCPELVTRLLRQTREVRNAGGRKCSVCNRSFVIPRTEWIEWWDCAPHENGLKGPRAPGQKLRPLPFLRRGCSWACVLAARRRSTGRLPDYENMCELQL